MKKPLSNGRVRLQSHIDRSLAARLEAFCAASAVTESAVVQAALRQYLDRSSDTSLLLRRLDRLDRAAARSQRDQQISQEAFATFIKLWFAHTPAIPEDAQRAARAHGQRRYTQFVEHIAQRLWQGAHFVDDLPQEAIADDAELTAVAETSEAASTSTDPNGPAAGSQRRGRS